jgi:hypothetical protein
VGDFHRLLVVFKQELAVVLGRASDSKIDLQAITDVLAHNLPDGRRSSKQESHATLKARLRVKAVGGALSGCFLYRALFTLPFWDYCVHSFFPDQNRCART